MSNTFPKGSEWRKWDLHIHTPASYDWHGGNISADDLIGAVKKAGLAAIAITDHHAVKWIDSVREAGRKQDITVLPGVELRTDKGNKGIHIIAIFDEPTDSKIIYDKVLAPLGFSDADVKSRGDEQVYCNYEDACKKIRELTGLIFLHAGKKHCGIEQLDNDARSLLKKDMAYLVDALEVNDVSRAEDYKKVVFPDVGRIWPIVITSDSVDRSSLTHKKGHSLEVIGQKFTWIKADPTFEGLRQILYEPISRISLEKNNPTPDKSNFTIQKVEINGATISSELAIQATKLELNHDLVAIVGGKGTGKTAFVDLIANCYLDRCNTKDKNSFVKRIVDHDPKIITELKFKSGSKFSKELREEEFAEDNQFVYVSQGELEQYIGEKSDIAQYIRDLIFESPSIKNSVKRFEFSDSIERVKELEERIKAKNQTIEELEQKTSSETVRNIDKAKKQNTADLSDIDRRIKQLEKAQSKAKIKLAEEKQEAMGNLKARQENLTDLRDLLRKATNFIDEQIPMFNEMVGSINKCLGKLGLKDKYKEFEYPQRADLTSMLESVKGEISKTIMEIEKMQKEIDRFEHDIQQHTKLLERKRELIGAAKRIQENTRVHMEEKKHLNQDTQERKQLMKELLEGIILQKEKYEEIINTFSSQKDEVLSDLTFVAEIRFDSNEFLEIAEGIVDNRKINISGDENNPPLFEKLIQLFHTVALGNKTKIDDLIAEIEHLNEFLKSKLKGRPVTTINFYNFMYRSYCNVIPIAKYKRTSIEKLSLGQKATVLIKIYLAQGDKPIVIDSHDDHLDNEFIMDELVKAIRQAKSFRQVILVSNNGNVVINSDAEQIIVANRDAEGKISYISGAIEEPLIRGKAIKVLEGGPEAFRKRQQKYRINRY